VVTKFTRVFPNLASHCVVEVGGEVGSELVRVPFGATTLNNDSITLRILSTSLITLEVFEREVEVVEGELGALRETGE